MTEPPQRRQAMPSLLELPGFLLAKLSPAVRRAVVAGTAVLALALAVLAVVLLPKIGADKREADRALERRKAAAAQERRSRQVRDQRPRSARLANAPTLAGAVEGAVVADARRRADAGDLDKRAIDAACDRDGAGPERGSVAFECVAATIRIPANRQAGDTSGVIGYPYRAVARPSRGRVTLCKVTGQAGEGGLQAGRGVALDAACGA